MKPLARDEMQKLQAIVNDTLIGVDYYVLPNADGSEYKGESEGLDCWITALRLRFRDIGSRIVTWVTPGREEGLTIVNDSTYPGTTHQVLDASDRKAWRDLVAHRVTAIGASWIRESDTMWALRLMFADRSVVIALGECYRSLSYTPDEMVVISREDIARSYQPQDTSSSSWGDLVE